MEILMFYVTFPDKDTAVQICNSLMESRLIACYNLIPIESCYWWEAKIVNESEAVCILKSSVELEAQIEHKIEVLHPYETVCIIRSKVSVNKSYGHWILDNTVKTK